MTTTPRVLDPEPVASFDAYVDSGGGRGLAAALKLGAAAAIEEVEASGLRGRGGAGFSTGTKWRTVEENRSPEFPTTVMVNGAEGEPGSFKDRMIMRTNPFRVLEGALIAARALRADRVVVAVKGSFEKEIVRLETALDAVLTAGWAEGIDVSVLKGPSEYLYGEETALLEVANGRQPFPRIAPPFRHGADEIGDDTASAADVDMAAPGPGTPAPPTLVNNVETMANVALVLAEGPEWFRSLGTAQSPGTTVCTVTGRTQRHGVGEFPMGTPLSDVLRELGGDSLTGKVVAVMSGVANPLVPYDLLRTPVSFEAMAEIGSGLGASGFIVFDEATDLVAVAHGVARFLAVESCGQCRPCKVDGLDIRDALDRLCRSEARANDLDLVQTRLSSVADGARCFLATQHERVVTSVLSLVPDLFRAHAEGSAPPVESYLVAPIVDIVDDVAILDDNHVNKQPDWSYDEEYSGQSPADFIDQRSGGPTD